MTLIDVTYGNVSQEQADRMVRAATSARGRKDTDVFPPGATEPWITDLVGALLKATGHPTALETGAFLGHTTRWLGRCLEAMGGGHLVACEIDPDRAEALKTQMQDVAWTGVEWDVHCADALSVIKALPDRSLGLAWVDDDHTMGHVSDEVAALWSKMAPRGIIALHDVYGSCDLRKVVAAYGGFCLDLPRAGPAGGLGLIQPIR